jgi:aminoglycoside phosphotransferase family enzyme/predicted kinase
MDASQASVPDVAETHISYVFFTADRAYKLAKHVRMPFLDLADRDTRLRQVERELELNRRIAPDVYLGLADVREGDDVVDRMLVMRRLPADRRLSLLVDDPRFASFLRAVVRRVAAFHASVPPVRPAPMATGARLAANWEDNFASIRASVGSVIDREEFDLVSRLARGYLAGRSELFEQRIRDGHVRDGHGDLLAEDIYCLDDGPRIIDCLAYDDDLRIGDVLLDVAFLVMDVHRLAGWEAARAVVATYDELSGEHHPSSLAHHYVAYRSHVRAKVACIRHRQGHAPSADLAVQHHRLALHHLERGQVRLVLVGGGPGVGKSVLAERLADRYGATVLGSDETRKELAGAPATEHHLGGVGRGIYDPATTEATYAELVRRAGVLLARGESVILDATFARRSHRSAARALATAHHAALTELECRLDPASTEARIVRRSADPANVSDATPEVAVVLLADRDPWPEASPVDTAATPDQVAASAVPHVDASK